MAATTQVKMRPGTSPRMEYDHGKDMMAKQIYSEKSRAAVYVDEISIRFALESGFAPSFTRRP